MRRMGCVFLLLNLGGAAFFVAVILLVLNGLGLTSIALRPAQWLLPGGGVLLAVLLTVMFVGLSNLRRMSTPLDDLLAASHQLAEGDYSARVRARGTPGKAQVDTVRRNFSAALKAFRAGVSGSRMANSSPP